MRGVVRRHPAGLAAALVGAYAAWVAEAALLGPRPSVFRPSPPRVEVRLDVFNESGEPVTVEEIALGGSRRYNMGGYLDLFPLRLRPALGPRGEFTTNLDLHPEAGTTRGLFRMRRGAGPTRDEVLSLPAPIANPCRLTVAILREGLAAEPCRPGLHLASPPTHPDPPPGGAATDSGAPDEP